MRLLARIFLAGSIAVTAMILLWKAIPLGVPGEWTWPRHASINSLVDVVDRLIPALVCGIGFVLFAEWGRRRITQTGYVRTVAMYLGLIGVSAGWLITVQKSTPVAYRAR